MASGGDAAKCPAVVAGREYGTHERFLRKDRTAKNITGAPVSPSISFSRFVIDGPVGVWIGMGPKAPRTSSLKTERFQ